MPSNAKEVNPKKIKNTKIHVTSLALAFLNFFIKIAQRRIVNATNTANIIKIFEQNVIVHIAKITLSKISGAIRKLIILFI